jgi:hypothetical protein
MAVEITAQIVLKTRPNQRENRTISALAQHHCRSQVEVASAGVIATRPPCTVTHQWLINSSFMAHQPQVQ